MDSKLTQKLLADQNELSNGKSQLCGYFDGPIRNIFLLAMAWALTLTTSTLLTTIGPLSVQSLGASDSLSAFAVGTFLLGAAVSSVPSARLFALYGRFIGFSVGCLCQCIGSILGAVAMKFRILELAYLGCFSIGLGQGLGQFYRFAAVEVSPPEYKSRAITYVLSGGILAAFLGPITANNTATLESPDYIGSYIIIALIGLLNLITVYFVQFPKPVKKLVVSQISSDESVNSLNFRDNNAQFIVNNLPQERSVLEIITQPLFIVSCAVATLAHTIMVMLMSDVTLAMTKDNFSLSSTSLVMELHFFSMFGPGFITGKLIGKYGSFQIAAAGAVVSLGAAVLFLLGTNAWNYFSGMILLGIGWNFSFSAGTVMLTDCYKSHEATKFQAINDFILFTIAGIGSLASGYIFSAFGWKTMVFVSLGLIILNIGLFGVSRSMRGLFNSTDESDETETIDDNSSENQDSFDVEDLPSRIQNPLKKKVERTNSLTQFTKKEGANLLRTLSVG